MEAAVSDSFGWVLAPGGLRLPPPLSGVTENIKNHKQQSTYGRRHAGATGDLRVVMEVTPCGSDWNFCGVATPGGLRLPLGSPG